MPNFNNWLGDNALLSSWIGTIDRSVDTARLIAEKPVSITLRRDGSALSAQTVRLEPTALPNEVTGQVERVSTEGILVIGYKGHATLTDTNIQRGDRFVMGDQEYHVIQVISNIPSRLLAYATAVD